MPVESISNEDLPFTEQVFAYSKFLLEKALRECNNNQAAAARKLGLTYDQLRHYLKKYNLEK